MKNEVLRCTDCHKEFVFYTSEQRRCLSNGWEDPIRCPSCRKKRRMWKAQRSNYRKGPHIDLKNQYEMTA